ncbi:MAG: sensor histidine kinase [Actinomycetota bacterium]
MDAARLRIADLVGGAALATALLAVMAGTDPDPGERPFDVLAAGLVLIAAGVLALHRRAPVAALLASTAAVVLYGVRDYPGGAVYLTVIGTYFALSVRRGPVRASPPVAASAAVLVPLAFRGSAQVEIALWLSWVVGALLLGGSVRARRAERAAMLERERRLVEGREEEARRRVAEERVRIARDLHDSVAHSMASISVQAGVGAHLIDERPEDARAALVAIKQASGEALAELRAALGMLRSSDDCPREPATSLDQLPSLVETSRAAGLPVDLLIEGELRPVPSAVGATAFRIVQESLTNVLRHAGPARASVVLRLGEGALDLEVTDDGTGEPGSTPGGGGGHGLAGMRERVALVGGSLQAGPQPVGGFAVRARLPL